MSNSSKRQVNFSRTLNVSFLLAFIMFIVFCLFIAHKQMDDIRKSYHKVNSASVYNVARGQTEKTLQMMEHSLTSMSKVLTKDGSFTDLKSINDMVFKDNMHRVLSLLSGVSNISLIDKNDEVLTIPARFSSHESAGEKIRQLPWYIKDPSSFSSVTYSEPYLDLNSGERKVNISIPTYNKQADMTAILSFELDIKQMGYSLRQKVAPMEGESFIVTRNGSVVIHPDPSLKNDVLVPKTVVEKMRNASGLVYDEDSNIYYYYYSYTNPDWLFIYKVEEETISSIVWDESAKVIYAQLVSALMLIICWILVHSVMKNMFMRVISSINSGTPFNATEEVMAQELINNSQKVETFRKQSTTDELTGLLNRRAFDEKLAQNVISKKPFCLAMVDIDNFKSLNDTYGHIFGDIVLRKVAEYGMGVVEFSGALLFRYGGEEMAVVFESDDPEWAEEQLNQWRVAVEEHNWREKGLKVTFSAGMGSWEREDPEAFIARIDALLYEAKHQGKNRVICAPRGDEGEKGQQA